MKAEQDKAEADAKAASDGREQEETFAGHQAQNYETLLADVHKLQRAAAESAVTVYNLERSAAEAAVEAVDITQEEEKVDVTNTNRTTRRAGPCCNIL